MRSTQRLYFCFSDIIDPSRPDKNVISYAEDILRAVQIDLENELPGYRIERSIVEFIPIYRTLCLRGKEVPALAG